jgi:hypothetical protein
VAACFTAVLLLLYCCVCYMSQQQVKFTHFTAALLLCFTAAVATSAAASPQFKIAGCSLPDNSIVQLL